MLLDDTSPVWEIDLDGIANDADRQNFNIAITAAREAFRTFNISEFKAKFVGVFGEEIANDLVAMHGSVTEEVLIQYMKKSLDQLQAINASRRTLA